MSDRKSQSGEGNREADRKYREDTETFIDKGKVDRAAEKARKQDLEEASQAEEQGRRRAKEEDPEVHREYDKPTKND